MNIERKELQFNDDNNPEMQQKKNEVSHLAKLEKSELYKQPLFKEIDPLRTKLEEALDFINSRDPYDNFALSHSIELLIKSDINGRGGFDGILRQLSTDCSYISFDQVAKNLSIIEDESLKKLKELDIVIERLESAEKRRLDLKKIILGLKSKRELLNKELNEKKQELFRKLQVRKKSLVEQMKKTSFKVFPWKKNKIKEKLDVITKLENEIKDNFQHANEQSVDYLEREEYGILSDESNKIRSLWYNISSNEEEIIRFESENKQITSEQLPVQQKTLQELKNILEHYKQLIDKVGQLIIVEYERRYFYENEVLVKLELKEAKPNSYVKEEKEVISEGASLENIRPIIETYFKYQAKQGGVSPEKLLERFEKSLDNVKSSYFIAFNVSVEALEKIIKTGKIKSLSEMTEKERLDKARHPFNAFGYLENRKEAEKEINIQHRKPIYAALCSHNQFDEERGPAPGELYGDFVIVLKRDVVLRTDFTVGDIMNGHYSLIDPLDPRSIGNPLHDPAKRQVAFKHALLAKAMYDDYFSGGEDGVYNRDPGKLHYIEAHVLDGVSIDDIAEIRSPDPDNIDKKLKNLLKKHNIVLRKSVYENRG